ncbi:MAG: hypothetical protein V4556_14495 [Bacteroidota bacterium]
MKKQTIIKWALRTLWATIGAGVIVLLVAAIQKKDAQHCADVRINIEGVDNNFFVDTKDILNSIKRSVGGEPVGRSVSAFNLSAIENELKKNVWVRTAQLFFDNNQVLRVHVFEREPMARIFTTTGTTFYIDSSIMMLPLSEKFSARLPMFTNFPSDKAVLSTADSALLKDILLISTAVQKDSFCMAMIDQVDITVQRTFQMIPKMGNQLIVFGDSKDVDQKLKKIKLFYKDAIVKSGWNYYSEINVQYSNQVVAKRRGAEDVTADSLRTLQLMQLIATNAEKQSADSMQLLLPDNDRNSTNIDLIQQSIERDDAGALADDNNAVSPAVAISKPLPLKAVKGEAPAKVVTPPVVKKTVAVEKKTTAAPTTKQTVKPAPVKNIKPLMKPVNKPQAKPAVIKKPPAKPDNDY